jgi:hypothetical protein
MTHTTTHASSQPQPLQPALAAAGCGSTSSQALRPLAAIQVDQIEDRARPVHHPAGSSDPCLLHGRITQ